MHKPFIDMAITDINRPVSPPSPWSLPAKGTIVLPTGFLTAAGLPQVEPAVNQALAALFCHQMKTSIDVVTDWLLAWTSDRRNRQSPAFTTFLRYAADKAEQRAGYEKLASQLTSQDQMAAAQDALILRNYHPAAQLLFVLETAWSSEWLADCARTSSVMTHPAVPALLASERRIDASARSQLRGMTEALLPSLSVAEARKAAKDLRQLYRDLEKLSARLAAVTVCSTEAVDGTSETRERLFACLDTTARALWQRPIRHLPAYERFLSALPHAGLLLEGAHPAGALPLTASA